MKKLGLILLIFVLICCSSACSKDEKTQKTKKTTTKKTEEKLETVLPNKHPSGSKPENYSHKLMDNGNTTESADNISTKYDYLIKKDFDLLTTFGVNLQDVATCCAVEKVTGCYLNYLTETKWTTAEEFRKAWTVAIKNLPKKFYTLMNDPDIPFDTKLKAINKYGYLAYPFVNDLYNYNFYSPADVCLVGNYRMTYVLTDEESELLRQYYEAYNLTEEEKTIIIKYMSNYMKFNEQQFDVH